MSVLFRAFCPSACFSQVELSAGWARPMPLFQTARSSVACSACLAPVAWPLIMCCQSMLQADLHTRRRVLDPSRPSQDASSPTQSFAWNSSHNRTVIWKINDSTSSLISSHLRNSIHVPQVHVLMPLTARTVQPNFGSGLCSCSRVPKPAQPTNSKAKRRSAQVHGSGVADL